MDFTAAVQKGSKINLTQFFEQWYERVGVPEWSIDWRSSGNSVEVTIRQTGQIYSLTPEIWIESAGKRVVRRVSLQGKRRR
jgi:aminopeptidase N